MSMTPCSADGGDAAMGDLMRRRLAENRSLYAGFLTSPSVGPSMANAPSVPAMPPL